MEQLNSIVLTDFFPETIKSLKKKKKTFFVRK